MNNSYNSHFPGAPRIYDVVLINLDLIQVFLAFSAYTIACPNEVTCS